MDHCHIFHLIPPPSSSVAICSVGRSVGLIYLPPTQPLTQLCSLIPNSLETRARQTRKWISFTRSRNYFQQPSTRTTTISSCKSNAVKPSSHLHLMDTPAPSNYGPYPRAHVCLPLLGEHHTTATVRWLFVVRTLEWCLYCNVNPTQTLTDGTGATLWSPLYSYHAQGIALIFVPNI